MTEQKKFNKKDFVGVLATNMGVTKKVAADAYNSFVSTMIETLLENQELNLTGIGKFTIKDVEAHKARNPKTGEDVEVPAKKKVSFKISTSLKKMANDDYYNDFQGL